MTLTQSTSLILTLASVTSVSTANAQIVPDGTTTTTIESIDSRLIIQGGSQAGGNLFHSFQEFSVPTNSEAYFNNAANIVNIFSRVTGGQASSIDGLIRANGAANLFLLNPAGIMFGPNAKLDLGGSFFATTARTINFSDGVGFSTDPSEGQLPLLTMSTPTGLQFGKSTAGITIRGNGYDFPLISFSSTTTDIFQTSKDFSKSTIGLRTSSGNTLGLIGNFIEFNQAVLGAEDGRIVIEAVPAESKVGLFTDSLGFQVVHSLPMVIGVLHFDPSPNNIFINHSAIGSNGNGGGNLTIRGNVVSIKNSDLFSDSFEFSSGRGISIYSNFLDIIDSSISMQQFGRQISPPGDLKITANNFNFVNSFIRSVLLGSGQASNIQFDILTKANLTGQDNLLGVPYGVISSVGWPYSIGSFDGNGQAGKIIFNSQEIALSGSVEVSSELFSQGRSGEIEINSESLILSNGSRISSSTFGLGDAGSISIRNRGVLDISDATSNTLNGNVSGIFSSVGTLGIGQGGRILIISDSLSIAGGGQISSSTLGRGNSGEIDIQLLGGLNIIGESSTLDISSSILSSNGSEAAVGQGGSIRISAQSILLQAGGQISCSSFGQGNAGDIFVYASDWLKMIGTDSSRTSPSGISAQIGSSSTGNGGSLNIFTNKLSLLNGAEISTSSFGIGNGGDINIFVKDSVSLLGNNLSRSGIYSVVGLLPEQSTDSRSEGNSGRIWISSRSIHLNNQSRINTSNFLDGFSAGSILLEAEAIELENLSSIAANTRGARGNIDIVSSSLVLRDRSQVSTNASGVFPGGNISINTNTLAAFNNSDISANAQNALGGQVNINAQAIFGTQLRSRSTSKSDITATSALGPQANGIVTINTPEIDPSSSLLKLPENLIDASQLINQTFCKDLNRSGGSFIITGRGGVGSTPDSFLDFNNYLPRPSIIDFIPESMDQSRNHSTINQSSFDLTPIVEANQWKYEDNGQISLISVNSQTPLPGMNFRGCLIPLSMP